MTEPLVLYAVEDKVATITLNRPEKHNALTRALWVEFDEVMLRVDEDPEVRVVVLTGAGRSFCSGADLAGDEDPTSGFTWHTHNQRHQRRQARIWDSQKIWIAGIDGYALGRGLEIALWCDIVVASKDAMMGGPAIRHGGLPHGMVPWLANPQQAKLFMLSGDTVGAEAAERIGFVTKVAEAGEGGAEAAKLARRLAHIPPLAAASIKRMVNGVYDLQGVRVQQRAASTLSTLNASLSPEERGVAHLSRILREQGFKAWREARDAPFRD